MRLINMPTVLHIPTPAMAITMALASTVTTHTARGRQRLVLRLMLTAFTGVLHAMDVDMATLIILPPAMVTTARGASFDA